jgi:BirA family biotin operon repressor/biotin-[acetyl-CoA-carboxylase] ligase
MNDVALGHRLDITALARDRKPRRIGRRITLLDEVDSTNLDALDALTGPGRDASDGHVVIAEHQSAGRGRLGRRWTSPRGASLMLSVLLWEDAAVASVGRWMMSSAIAVVEAIESETDVAPVIRWPNDVCLGDRKLAGILVETRTIDGATAAAVGIGINCLQHAGHFPPELRGRATSLEMGSRRPVDRQAIARSLLGRLDAWFAGDAWCDERRIIETWQSHSHDIGRRVELMADGERYAGVMIDVHPTSGILVQLDLGGRRHFDPATTSRIDTAGGA